MARRPWPRSGVRTRLPVVFKRPKGGFTPSDADALAYVTAVQSADGSQLEEGVSRAIDDFVVGCKADGIWSAIKASCILCGARTLAGINVPLVGSTPTFNAFTSQQYNRKTGLAGNGSTMWIDSGRNNNADPQNSKHIAVFRSEAATNDAGLLGSNAFTTGHSHLYTGFNSYISRLNSGTQGTTTPLASFTGARFFGASRSSSAGFVHRIGGTDVNSTAASETPANATLRVFETGGRTNARLAFYSIGESLDLALLESRVISLYNAIGAAIT